MLAQDELTRYLGSSCITVWTAGVPGICLHTGSRPVLQQMISLHNSFLPPHCLPYPPQLNPGPVWPLCALANLKVKTDLVSSLEFLGLQGLDTYPAFFQSSACL